MLTLEKIRAHFRRHGPVSSSLGIEVLDVGREYSLVETPPYGCQLNGMGAVYDGAAFILADVAFVALSNANGLYCTNAQTPISSVCSGCVGPLREGARVLRSGKLPSTHEVRVTDAEGGPVAVATITGYGVGARLPLGDAQRLRVSHWVFRRGMYSKKEGDAVSVAAMWSILGIILPAVELMFPVFVLFFLGLGMWAAGVTVLLVDDLTIEVVVFGASSVVFLLSLCRLSVRSFRGKTQISSDTASVGLPNLHAGKMGTVTRSIPVNGVGEILVGGSFWRTASPEAQPEGAQVCVLGHIPDDELTLEVVSGGENSRNPAQLLKHGEHNMFDLIGPSLTVLVFLASLVIFALFKTALVVPNQQATVVERFDKFHTVLFAGFYILIPFIDAVAYRHSLKEDVLDVPKQTCIMKDNVSVDIDGVLYLQVVNPEKSVYDISNHMSDSVQFARTALRPAIGKLELDRTFEEHSTTNQGVISALDAATAPWGVKVLRYEIRNITPPSGVTQAMEKQTHAGHEKHALIAQSEGEMQARINMTEGAKVATIAEFEGKLQVMKNQAEGDAVLIRAVVQATADDPTTVVDQMEKPGGMQAVNLCVAESYLRQFGKSVKEGNTMIPPTDLVNISGPASSPTSVIKQAEV